MRIDKKLNIVVPIGTDIGNIYVHSAPISRDIFEEYFMVLSRTYAMIYAKGLHFTGPRIAHLVLKQVSQEEGEWDRVQNGLMNEVIRLTNVIVPSDNGYVTRTLSDALSSKVITPEEFSDIKGTLVFFTVVSAVAQKELIEPTMRQIADLWGTSSTPLNSTEYKNSLQKLIEERISETSAAVIPSLIPS